MYHSSHGFPLPFLVSQSSKCGRVSCASRSLSVASSIDWMICDPRTGSEAPLSTPHSVVGGGGSGLHPKPPSATIACPDPQLAAGGRGCTEQTALHGSQGLGFVFLSAATRPCLCGFSLSSRGGTSSPRIGGGNQQQKGFPGTPRAVKPELPLPLPP